jgi:uncharacterized protein with von Willebrand factor type A (vWA) domain
MRKPLSVLLFLFLATGLRAQNNIVFLLDVSNSMGRDGKMELLKRSTEELCKLLNRKDRVSLLTFGFTVETVYASSSFGGPDSLLKVLGRVRSTASATNINRGIYDAYEACTSLKLPRNNHVLLITDGEFLLNPFTKDMVKKREDIILTCVIVGKGPSAEKAVKYVNDELKLKVITLVNEAKDAGKLADLVGAEMKEE